MRKSWPTTKQNIMAPGIKPPNYSVPNVLKWCQRRQCGSMRENIMMKICLIAVTSAATGHWCHSASNHTKAYTTRKRSLCVGLDVDRLTPHLAIGKFYWISSIDLLPIDTYLKIFLQAKTWNAMVFQVVTKRRLDSEGKRGWYIRQNDGQACAKECYA